MERHLIKDSKDQVHEFISKWNDRVCSHFYYLDGARIGVDDRVGWAYEPSGRPVRDAGLRSQLDKIVFGTELPYGEDKEAEWKE